MPILTLWRFSDSKRGHDNISRGFVDAVADQMAINVHDLPCLSHRDLIRAALGKTPASWRQLDPPSWVVGAGHRTHWSMLAAKRLCHARAVVLMSPSLPHDWFDVRIVPRHDRPGSHPEKICRHTLLTHGVPNRVQPPEGRPHQHARNGLILVGGPSAHHSWLDAEIAQQLRTVLTRSSATSWTITNSRRTPQTTTRMLSELPGAQFVDCRDVGADWLLNRFDDSAFAWVSEDSVSMVYESLTAGLAVGLLKVPRRTSSRVIRGVGDLIMNGRVRLYDEWLEGADLSTVEPRLDESRRAAKWFVENHASQS
ncbi:MAG: mitochondrial fission ELM1 family protein [Gammaproteobacteria bacterium]|nr:mitochondrial fission ELM1 family protein [Gammaproteobacteria bacterium]